MRLLNDKFDVKTASNEALSFIGDAVYSLLVRERLCCDGNCRSGILHKLSAESVNAAAQAKGYIKIKDVLTEKEAAVYKRGRNAHNNHTPKNAKEGDYHSATGIEALFGYLYLNGESERIAELFEIIRSGEE